MRKANAIYAEKARGELKEKGTREKYT